MYLFRCPVGGAYSNALQTLSWVIDGKWFVLVLGSKALGSTKDYSRDPYENPTAAGADAPLQCLGESRMAEGPDQSKPERKAAGPNHYITASN